MSTITPNMIKAIKEKVEKGKNDVLMPDEEVLVLKVLNEVKDKFPGDPVAQLVVPRPTDIEGENVYDRQSVVVALAYAEQLVVAKNVDAAWGGV